MQKIIVLVDPRGIDTSTLDFTTYLVRTGTSKLYGVFLHPDSQEPVPEMVINNEKSSGSDQQSPSGRRPVNTDVDQSKKEWLAYYKNQGFGVHPETADVYTREQIIEETRFADAVIVNGEISFSGGAESVPTKLIEFILKKSECPVIVAPMTFDPIEEVVFAYDGSPSSVFAAKEFTRVFPQFEDKRITFLEINMDESSEITNQQKITDYLKLHYSSIGYRVLHGKPEDELFGHFLSRKNTFLVLGAFGRSPLSVLLHKSSANLLLKTSTLPLFITHR